MPLIAFEGGDAAGKATQSKLLVERVIRHGGKSVLYSFPRYGTPLGAEIRRMLMGELAVCARGASVHMPWVPIEDTGHLVLQCMMFADRYDAAVGIHEHLRAGSFVVCDRWAASAEVYGAAEGLPPEWLRRTQARLPGADLTILLDVPEEVARTRMQGRTIQQDKNERDREKQGDVVRRYKMLATTSPETWVVVDGNPSREDVHRAIWEIVNHRWAFVRSEELAR